MVTVAEVIDEAQEALSECLNDLRQDSEYYEACVSFDIHKTRIPEQNRDISAAVGWSRLYLDSLVARIKITGFRTQGMVDYDERLMDWWDVNNLDQEANVLLLEMLIHGRAFVTISEPMQEDIDYGHPADVPIIRIESPRNMWVDIDPRTKRVNWAVRFFYTPCESPHPLGPGANNADQRFTVYLPNETILASENDDGGYTIIQRIRHNLGFVPVVPFLNRERASDRYGRSEIIPELRSLQDIATRVVLNMQTAADLMAVPQRILFGVDKDAIAMFEDNAARYKAYMASILAFEDGEGASATQFSAAELSNYTGVLQELSRIASSYTGLPPQYLSFNSQNPSSADAIRSAETRLVKLCEIKGEMFGKAMVQVMQLASRMMLGSIPEEYRRLKAILADPSTPTYAAKADAATKLVGGKPVIPVKRARIDMGYTPEERAQMEVWDEQEADEMMAAMMGRPSSSVRFQLPAAQDEQSGSTEETGVP